MFAWIPARFYFQNRWKSRRPRRILETEIRKYRPRSFSRLLQPISHWLPAKLCCLLAGAPRSRACRGAFQNVTPRSKVFFLTDHAALQKLFPRDLCSKSRVMRLILRYSEYTFKIEYQKWQDSVIAYVLFRLFLQKHKCATTRASPTRVPKLIALSTRAPPAKAHQARALRLQ